MSKVKIQGNASGSGVFTLTTPNTSTDRTITLPDASGTLAFTTDDDDKLPLAGGTMTGTIVHGDNIKDTYGAGADLEIYHDGAHNRLQCPTGELKLRASAVRIGSVAGENGINMVGDGAVELYHNNVKKIETTANGAYVTGELEVTQAANNEAVDVSTNATTTNAIRVIASELTTGRAAYFYSNASGTQTRQILRIDNDHANATGTTCLYVGNDSTGLAADFHGDIRSRDGIKFGTDTAASNALDDYEEGTWTPSFGSGISVSSGTCNLAGTYTKIGNTVFIRLTATGTYVLSANAAANITGLPFNIAFLNVGEGLAHDVSGGEKSICEFYSNQSIYIIDALGSAIANLRVSGSYLPS